MDLTKAQRQRTEQGQRNRSDCLIVSGGLIEEEFAREILRGGDYRYIIGADRGVEFLYHEGVCPTHIVGDFDSLPQEVLEEYVNNPKVVIRMFSPIKDATDTELALNLAVELKSSSIRIIGGNGARLDHTLGNIQALTIPLKAGIPCRMTDAHNDVMLLDNGLILPKETLFGRYFSLFALGGPVEGLTVTGAKYNVSDILLTSDNTLGVSNEAVEDILSIGFSSGRLVLVQSRD